LFHGFFIFKQERKIKLQISQVRSREFWENAWKEARDNSPMVRRRCRIEQEMVDNWNRRAQWFARRTSGARGEQRQKVVFDMLEQQGVLNSEVKVLDVGAGPGNFAVPMARLVREVTALEPAQEMIKIMEDKASTEELSNINIIQRTWQDINVEEDGLAGGFDLVFASMTPGVQDPETLQKLIAASKKYCYYSSFSGNRWSKAYHDLWRCFFNEDMGDNPGDIIYPLNLLYALGYRPSLHFFTNRQVQEQPAAEAVEELLKFFWSYIDITSEVRQVVEEYVQKNVQDGILCQSTTVSYGMLLWRVD
jgi:2-polyprenyl-3-methyl-5-hydroxy-6-metoxy-1,4-benzoquinol methylase